MRLKQEAEANADEDKKAKERIDKLNSADAMIFQTEKQLKEFGDKLPDDKKEPIEKSLADLKEAHKSQDLEAIEKAMNEMNTNWQAASEEIYKSQQAQDEPAADQTEGDQKKGDDEVTDVDFEEVK